MTQQMRRHEWHWEKPNFGCPFETTFGGKFVPKSRLS
jgi:hypothetical protein